jgi:uncharacterized membrane protein YjfL (UPF0719 family)
MSGDEVFVTLAAAIVGLGGWALWFLRASSIDTLGRGRATVAVAAAVLCGAALLIAAVLKFCAADDVRDAPQYLFMYAALGLAWTRLSSALFPFVGLHPRDDLFERGNRAALPAWSGAILAVALCYAGGNVGNGPGWWVVVFSAGLATAALFGLWMVFAQISGNGDAVVVDRDPSAGVRLGGFLVACGVTCGAAVTGDWVSAPFTVADFVARIWPAAVILVAAAFMERAHAPRPDRPRGSIFAGGVVPAAVFLGIALGAAVLMQGRGLW